MMVLSRIWYIVLSILVGMALCIVMLATGQYNRRNAVAMTEELASDSQTVGWALQLDARKRLDALLLGAVDKGVEDALTQANNRDTIPNKARDDGRRALTAVLDKIPQDFRPDALFAVDHDGRVIAQVGYDVANSLPDFELGGYPAVFDALHGFLRDDTWVLGGRLYRVVARPVEFDATQPPLGAIVGVRLMDKRFAQALSKRTRANISFFASGQRVASAAGEGFDEGQLDLLDTDLGKLGDDKEFAEGRSEVRPLSDKVGAMYARLPGDAWDLGAGFAVARARITVDGWLGFVNGADDKDKAGINFLLVAGIVLIGILGGMGLSWVEHSLPLAEMRRQSQRLKKGEIDYFQVPRFRGSLRNIAQEVNQGIERVLEKGGAAVRKPADLESILGPVPAQPAMSAFAFPLADGGGTGALGPGGPASPRPGGPGQRSPASEGSGARALGPPGQTTSGSVSGVNPAPLSADRSDPSISITGSLAGTGSGARPAPKPQGPPGASAISGPIPPSNPGPIVPQAGPPIANAAAPVVIAPRPGGVQVAAAHSPADADGPTLAARSPAGPGFPAPDAGSKGAAPPRRGGATMLGIGNSGAADAGPAAPAAMSPNTVPTDFVPPGAPGGQRPPQPSRPQVSQPTPFGAIAAGGGLASGGAAKPGAPPPRPQGLGAAVAAGPARPLRDLAEEGEDEATVVAPAPSELLAQSSPGVKPQNETAEWMTVYDDFVRTKKQCGEPTEGLTFEKFQATLKKNRDNLIQRHNCKRVRFSVYVKEGRASLKATPVRD